MGRHLDKLNRLDKLTATFQKALEELLEISQEGARPDKNLLAFTFVYAMINYQFSIYLIKKFPKAIEADKIDKKFNNIMKNFDRKKRDKDGK